MATVPSYVAIVEYIGTFPTRCSQKILGTSKEQLIYIRTKDLVICELKKQLKKHSTAKTVQHNMNQQIYRTQRQKAALQS